jgi:hypothetical protein
MTQKKQANKLHILTDLKNLSTYTMTPKRGKMKVRFQAFRAHSLAQDSVTERTENTKYFFKFRKVILAKK